MIQDLNLLVTFARVADAGSFTGAARLMNSSKSAVSRQVSSLEEVLGVRLLNRTTRKLSLTEAGAAVLARCERIVAEAEEAELAATQLEAAVSGTLSVSAPMSFGISQLGRVMPDFIKAHPNLTVQLELDDRRVDLVDEGFDVGLRITAMQDSSLIARAITPIKSILVGAPDYFDKVGRPSHPNDLKNHQCVRYSLADRQNIWMFHRQGDEPVRVPITGPVVSNNGEMTVAMVRGGVGLAYLPDFLVADEIAKGTLEAVLPEWAEAVLTCHAIYPSRHHVPTKVRVFVDYLVEQFSKNKAAWRR
jgi:DNA-binding transcriptional LysR family regulator